MSEQKKKVSDLPENEQKELIAQAYAVGLKGVFNNYGVETLKTKIAEQKALNQNQQGDNSGEQQQEGQDGSADEQNSSDGEQNASTDEQGEENDEQTTEPLPEGLSDEAKQFLNGETDKLPEETETITENEALELQNQNKKETENDDLNKDETILPKVEQVQNGICHICRSRVENGVCTGCGFKKTIGG